MNKLITGDCRTVIPALIADGVQVQTCITSPPYFGLRDYGHHDQIGAEHSVDDYVATLVAVFGQIKQLLKDDGTLWLNLGDSYSGSGKGRYGDGTYHITPTHQRQHSNVGSTTGVLRTCKPQGGLKPKDLIGIPWRVALALQADGWYLRQDIIWHKPNPMPSAVTDRCVTAHEYLFLLSKSEHYYFDHLAIQEPSATWARQSSQHRSQLKDYKAHPMRNKRSVWTVPTTSNRHQHIAAFPRKLIEPCILAGSRSGDVVLDPFMGSGTVAAAANKLARKWIGIELNQDYASIHADRVVQAALELN